MNAIEQFKHDDSDCIYIRFWCWIASMSVFFNTVVWLGSTTMSGTILRMINEWKAEISKFKVLIANEDIIGFNIIMDNGISNERLVAMNNIYKNSDDLKEVPTFMCFIPIGDESRQTIVLTIFHNKVEISIWGEKEGVAFY